MACEPCQNSLMADQPFFGGIAVLRSAGELCRRAMLRREEKSYRRNALPLAGTQLPGCPKLSLLLVLLAVGATATRPRLRVQQHQRQRCEAPLCQWKPDLPPPDPDTVSARSAETQERLKVLIEELSAPVSDQGAAPKPSAGYAVDYANLKPKANVFGARLDPKVAGETLIGVNAAPEEPHEEIFAAGVKAMKGGYYKDAVRYFTQAVAAAPGGLTGREGGQYSVWLAQALQAAGRTKEAVGAPPLLRRASSPLPPPRLPPPRLPPARLPPPRPPTSLSAALTARRRTSRQACCRPARATRTATCARSQSRCCTSCARQSSSSARRTLFASTLPPRAPPPSGAAGSQSRGTRTTSRQRCTRSSGARRDLDEI